MTTTYGTDATLTTGPAQVAVTAPVATDITSTCDCCPGATYIVRWCSARGGAPTTALTPTPAPPVLLPGTPPPSRPRTPRQN